MSDTNRPVLRSLPAALIIGGALVVASTGGAVAGGLITGKQIKDNTVTTADIKNGTLQTKDLSKQTVSALHGAKGAPGAAGLVRGWAVVGANGTITAQSGGITLTHPDTGNFCLTVPGVTQGHTAPVASPDYDLDDSAQGVNAPQAVVEIRTTYCDAPSVGVRTLERTIDENTHDLTTVAADEPFTVLIP